MDRRRDITRMPTIHDLRVKFCYICQEEELFDALNNPPRAWTHPCTCTLVAHESCLLRWIQTSQADAARAVNAMKCPQCGTKYELISNRPQILRLLGLMNRILHRTGRIVTLVGVAGMVGVFASGVYAIATKYGSWAVQQFIGQEMHGLLLSDDPNVWPRTTLFNLPSVPFALILARFQPPRLIPSIISILLLWPPIPPNHVHEVLASNAYTTPVTPSSILPADLRIFRSWSNILWSWPPTPTLFGFILVPLIRYVYRKAWTRLQVRVLGSIPPSVRNFGDIVVWDGWPIVIRIRTEIDHNGADQQQHGQEQDENQALEVAEQNIATMRSSLGRRIGGALLVPWISNWMGALLLAASKHSVILRRILALRLPLQQITALVPGHVQAQGLLGQLQRKLGMVWQSTIRGSSAWVETDPVWWRNALGLGLFVVVKDTIELLHLWLATRELESRHVKNRDFAGVEICELDLVPGFPHPTLDPTAQSQHSQSLPEGL
ncbi:E3 ubiquitin-protein ligase MARCH5 [Termitomyces sp. J132]|nr:E3 ubiquitin-protein ligase MARCH5 [Termitomyces sp. J132]